MKFKKSLIFYLKFFSGQPQEEFYCQSQFLFWNLIVSNIDSLKFDAKNGNKIKKKTFEQILGHAILFIISIITLIKSKIRKIKYAHYMVDINNSNNGYDFRSKYILDVMSPAQSINFFHINDFRYSIRNIFNKDNPFYFESVYFFLRLFLRPETVEIKIINNNAAEDELVFAENILEYYCILVEESAKMRRLFKVLLKFLNLNKFIFFDDPRHTNELILACNDNNISTVGYMHGRFNEFHVGLFYYPFDKYLVWSQYFKDKILHNNKKYLPDNIFIIGHPRLKNSTLVNRSPNPINVLWLGESNINYEEIFPYINKLIESEEFIVYFKGKPGANVGVKEYINLKNIEELKENNFFECLKLSNISLVIGTHSTALMECWLIGVPSLIIKCSYDYGRHLWEDDLIELCDDPDNLINLAKKNALLTKNKINDKLIRIWGERLESGNDLIKNIILYDGLPRN